VAFTLIFPVKSRFGEFLFYIGNTGLFFRPLTSLLKRPPVSTQTSRKAFLAKLTGFLALAGLAPKMFAKSASSAAAPVSPKVSFTVRPDARSVARSADSV